MTVRFQLCVSAIMMMLAVSFGAFGAHALRDTLNSYSMELWNKASFYHFVHALALLVLGVASESFPDGRRLTQLPFILILLGIFIFSGSLYLLALLGLKQLGALTPIGGSLFILGWVTLAVKSLAVPGKRDS